MPTDGAWIAASLERHNKLRALHGASPLTWSQECTASAQRQVGSRHAFFEDDVLLQADKCQAEGRMFHDNCEGPSGRHGQNIFWTSSGVATPEQATQAWYDELTDPGYDFAKPGFAPGTGHFTQAMNHCQPSCLHDATASGSLRLLVPLR